MNLCPLLKYENVRDLLSSTDTTKYDPKNPHIADFLIYSNNYLHELHVAVIFKDSKCKIYSVNVNIVHGLIFSFQEREYFTGWKMDFIFSSHKSNVKIMA